MKPYIFSKQSLEKQNELRENCTGWIRWLRGLFEESAWKAMEVAQLAMQRHGPEGEEKYDDKWKMRLRLRSWSHSIRPNQLTSWNKSIDKIKLISTADRNELIVEFITGKNLLMGDLWGMGMQSSTIFLCALNIATGGFFWWYVPTYRPPNFARFAPSHSVLLPVGLGLGRALVSLRRGRNRYG
jgi:hypothetical protein